MILTWEEVKSPGRPRLKSTAELRDARIDRIDEENASCVTARVMCPSGNNPEDS